MGNVGGKRKPNGGTPLMDSRDVIIKRGGGVSLITQEMRAQGMNLTQNMLRELENRNLGEVKTTELVKMIIQMMGYFIPKPQGGGDTVIDVTQTEEVKDILKQIGMSEEGEK